MADNADIAATILEDVVTIATMAARAPIPAGTSGECAQCEWWMPRLVDGRCGFCRDGRQRPPDWEPPTPPTPIGAAAPTEEHVSMAEISRKIEFTGAALVAIETLAEDADLPFKAAAAELVVLGAKNAEKNASAPIAPVPAEPTIQSIVADLHTLFDRLVERADEAAQRPDLSAELADATARAEAAEARLAQAKALFA